MRNFLILASAIVMGTNIHAADKASEFNGRWNLQVQNEPRGRAWWLEVEGAGTPQIRGNFVGAPGGDLDRIPAIRTERDELVFEFDKRFASARDGAKAKGVYRVRLSGKDRIDGELQVEGSPQLNRKFTGVRAPAVTDKDGTHWKKGKPIELFNGRDLTGWTPMVPGKALGWQVKDGLMSNQAGANNLTTGDLKFWNFELHAEFRLGKDSNSGIGLRGRYEVQILDDFGKPAESHGNGAIYSRKAPARNASKAPGEWQTFDIRLVGRFATVVVNGEKVIDQYEIPGLTAVATDANESQPGPITIQGDHGAVDFRKLTIVPLTR